MPFKKSPPSQVLENKWSPRTDLNRQPADYKSAALPLSYVGLFYRKRDACCLPYPELIVFIFYHIR